MQRARPTTITPVRYAGWSARKSQASANISAGPTTQLRNSETPKQPPVAAQTGPCPRSGPSRGPGTSSAAGRARSAGDGADLQLVQEVVEAGDERARAPGPPPSPARSRAGGTGRASRGGGGDLADGSRRWRQPLVDDAQAGQVCVARNCRLRDPTEPHRQTLLQPACVRPSRSWLARRQQERTEAGGEDEERRRPEAGLEALPLVEQRRRARCRRAGRRRWPCSRSRRSSRPCRRRRRRGSGRSGRRS